jgi:hypothetical protein
MKKHLFTQPMDFKLLNMKPIFLIAFISISFFKAECQANLLFNQVLSYTNTISGPITVVNNTITNATTNYVVPSGKTWKIESINFYNDSWDVVGSTNGGSNEYIPEVILKVNGVKVKASPLRYYGNVINYYSISGNLIDQPLWLKSGDIITFSIRNDNYNGGTINGSTNIHYSIIEYNIVP